MLQVSTIIASAGILVGAECALFGCATVMTRSVARGVADGFTLFSQGPQRCPAAADWAVGITLSGGLLMLGGATLIVQRACRGPSQGSL